jgi:hypothetical protein
MPDQAGPKLANVALYLTDIIPEGVQLSDYHLITVGSAVAVAPADDGPGYDDDQDAERSHDSGDGLNSYRVHARWSAGM